MALEQETIVLRPAAECLAAASFAQRFGAAGEHLVDCRRQMAPCKTRPVGGYSCRDARGRMGGADMNIERMGLTWPNVNFVWQGKSADV